MQVAIHTERAPAAIGPYSQGVTLGNLVFTSGQLPLVAETMAFPDGGIQAQTRQALLNLQAVLEQSGASFNSVIKTTCFLADMADFVDFNAVYGDFFAGKIAPARSCVQVGRLPKDALVEIEAVAFVAS
ncbi:2-iminobutanoate/2-iminopropanoate deaminase [Klebsiella spallanzanii]|uniref:2-iminobutanoate/2-iminopropanoate deaminase n=1 Tax=Klebsiella spallanzanii TaxID=2587528 RepID=A0A564KFQ2_9ENTR|nr:RidA family protein [Klebsiella spallanzanii]VUS30990.1 2-iminobutanoate/2-iminopropanoate deaminase [Klebsiella spallanzanii]VUS68081.1 2-iminobutanoate/2-iminopropanoate deaminase [Klebsiella spallanzanii]